jgi:bacterioferritin
MQQETVVNTLNEFLEGNYMAVHAYERYIEQVEDPKIKKGLQTIQQDHKQHALKIAEQIQNLGGVAVDGVGLAGTISEWFQKIKGDQKTEEVLQAALKGEEKGIESTEKLVRGDLDQRSLELVRWVLNEDRRHIKQLKQLKQLLH